MKRARQFTAVKSTGTSEPERKGASEDARSEKRLDTKKGASRKQDASRALKSTTGLAKRERKDTRPSEPNPTRPQNSGGGPKSSKTSVVLSLIRQPSGASLAEIAKVTGWQNHSIRGFISGVVVKKMGLKVDSTRDDSGNRTYRIPG